LLIFQDTDIRPHVCCIPSRRFKGSSVYLNTHTYKIVPSTLLKKCGLYVLSSANFFSNPHRSFVLQSKCWTVTSCSIAMTAGVQYCLSLCLCAFFPFYPLVQMLNHLINVPTCRCARLKHISR